MSTVVLGVCQKDRWYNICVGYILQKGDLRNEANSCTKSYFMLKAKRQGKQGTGVSQNIVPIQLQTDNLDQNGFS